MGFERSFVMRFSAFALVSVGLLFLQPAPNPDDYVLQNGTVCHPEGTAHSEKGKALNRHKNRYRPPSSTDIDPSITLTAMLAPAQDGDEDRFDEERAAVVQGYVIDAKTSHTPESCNCSATNAIDQDTH